MRQFTISVFLVSIVLLVQIRPGGMLDLTTQAQSVTRTTRPINPDNAKAPLTLRRTPFMFIENIGQIEMDVHFQMHVSNATLYLADNALWMSIIDIPKPSESNRQITASSQVENLAAKIPTRQGVHLKLSFVGANSHPRLEPFGRMDTYVSSFVGNNSAKWRANIPAWSGVRYVDIYPGLDLEISSENGRLAQRLIVRDNRSSSPHSSQLPNVRLRVDGADKLALEDNQLLLTTAIGEFVLPLLEVTNASGDSLGNPTLIGNQVIAPFASTTPRSLILSSPSAASDLLYSTFLGGSDNDCGICTITVDKEGNVYLVGTILSSDFPTTPGAFDTTYNGGYYDAVVVKMNPGGTGLTYATFLGGSDNDGGHAISVDEAGNAYVAGYTQSLDFPTTPEAFDTSHNGLVDAFVAKLNPTGTGLIYSSFLGGSNADGGGAGTTIAVDGTGSAYVTISTLSSDFPTTPGAFDTTYNGGYYDAVVVKMNPTGTGLTYATFLGGSDADESEAIAIDGVGNAYVTGWTWSSNFPTTPEAFDTSHNGGFYDAFVVKVNTTGTGLVYATFLGGSRSEGGSSITVDGTGSAYVTGDTGSFDFPTTPEAFDTSYNGTSDAFVVKLNPTGTGLTYASFLGGSNADGGNSIAMDNVGNAYVTGFTQSPNFPTTVGAFDRDLGGPQDAFVAKLNPTGTELTYATFLGGSDEAGNGEQGFAVVVDGINSVYIGGATLSSNFPTTPEAFDTSYNGNVDAFVTKLRMGDGGSYSISGRVIDSNRNPLEHVTVSDDRGHTAVTDSNGSYVLAGLSSDTYILTASKDGYAFSPPRASIDVPEITQKDFVGTHCSSSGKWYAEYYDNRDLQGKPAHVQCDTKIDFYWGEDRPDDNVPENNFSVRWKRTVDFPAAGWYHFRTFTDDGLRLYIDGEKIIDDWTARTFAEQSKFKRITEGAHEIVMEYVEWEHEAMAHFTWYHSLLCPENAIGCTLIFTPTYQTHYLTDFMPRKDQCTNVANQTIARWGCLITSHTMALQALGVNTNVQELNQWLTENGGYYMDKDPCYGGLRDGSYVALFAQDKYKVTLDWVELRWQQGVDPATILKNERTPVIMGVVPGNGGQHFYLATDVVEVVNIPQGRTQETLGIYDPHHAWICQAVPTDTTIPSSGSSLRCNGAILSHVTTLQEVRSSIGSNTWVQGYLKATESRVPTLGFNISGAEVLLADEQGRRTGYDGETGQLLYEIPYSGYYDSEIVPPGGEPDDVIDRNLRLSDSAAGSYRLTVTSPTVSESAPSSQTTSDFQIDIVGFDSQLAVLEAKISGTVLPGETLEYLVTYEPDTGQLLTSDETSTRIYLPVVTRE